jgi:Flp pilus assembly protein TadD
MPDSIDFQAELEQIQELMRRGELESAEARLQQLLQQGIQESSVWFLLGAVNLQQGRPGQCGDAAVAGTGS